MLSLLPYRPTCALVSELRNSACQRHACAVPCRGSAAVRPSLTSEGARAKQSAPSCLTWKP
eukprot:7834039-Alexandrium_andersonii.AAC.1